MGRGLCLAVLFLLTFELAKIIFKQINSKNIKLYKQDEYKAKYYNVIKNSYLSITKRKIKNKTYNFNKKNLIR